MAASISHPSFTMTSATDQHSVQEDAFSGMSRATVASQRTVSAVFVKTKRCRFFGMGMCTKGDACTYAHKREELRPSPDFFRTKLCPAVTRGEVCNDALCKFAHTKEEKRKSVGSNRLDQTQAMQALQVIDNTDKRVILSENIPAAEKQRLTLSVDGAARPAVSSTHIRLRPRGCRAGKRHSSGKATGTFAEVVAKDAAKRTSYFNQSIDYAYPPQILPANFCQSMTPSTDVEGSEYQDLSDSEDASTCTLSGSCSTTSEFFNSSCPSPPPDQLEDDELVDAILVVQNTFLTLEPAQPILERRLRRVHSAPGCLEKVIEEMQPCDALQERATSLTLQTLKY